MTTGKHLVLCDDPQADARAFRAVYAHYLATCVRKFVDLESQLPEALRGPYSGVVELVQRALAIDESLLLHCFASPAVGTPLHCLALRETLPEYGTRIADSAAAMLPHLLFEMALHGLLEEGAAWDCQAGAPRLASLAIGGAVVPPEDTTGLVFSATSVVAAAGGAEVAQLPLDDDGGMRAACEAPGGFRFEGRYHPVGNVTHFATVDHNPIAAFEAHPDKSGNAVDLGGRPEGDWIGMLDEAFALVERFLPSTFAEMQLMLQEVVPVGYDSERHLSASYREAIGTMYLTLHPNVMTMTEAIVHEFQHNKLNVASYGAEFLTNAFQPLYPSPIRPDPRPLWGILLAVHAFLPVAELYRRMRESQHPLAADPGFEARLSDIDLKNHEGMEMLRAHAQLTPAGVALFADLEALEQRHLADRSARGLSNVPTEVHQV
jgi:HEXXH motif-containing protein